MRSVLANSLLQVRRVKLSYLVLALIEKGELERIQGDLRSFDETRENVLDRSRLLIRLSGWSIVQIHRRELQKAAATLKEAQKSLREIHSLLRRNPELGNTGNVRVAEQEYAEARCLYVLVRSGKLPSIKQIHVESTSYILGLLDLIGELRRLTLNHLRRGKETEAERTFATMEQMYEDLLSLDHTAIVPTFRNKADNARRIIESTRGDVVTEIRRLSLETAIKHLENKWTAKT